MEQPTNASETAFANRFRDAAIKECAYMRGGEREGTLDFRTIFGLKKLNETKPDGANTPESTLAGESHDEAKSRIIAIMKKKKKKKVIACQRISRREICLQLSIAATRISRRIARRIEQESGSKEDGAKESSSDNLTRKWSSRATKMMAPRTRWVHRGFFPRDERRQESTRSRYNIVLTPFRRRPFRSSLS